MESVVLRHARIATLRGGKYSMVEDGAIVAQAGRIAWVGATCDLPRHIPVDEGCIDARGALVTPGLIDCHTHLVYAGTRADEFERRLQGESYESIARAGGGILSTVRATRAASGPQLRAQSLQRLEALRREGVVAVEIKSGYGLDLENELRCLRVARSLSASGVHVSTTLLGAHAVPPEFAGDSDGYVDFVCGRLIPAAANERAADAVDAFMETIGFSEAQTRRIFEAARSHGLRVKLHADQLSNSGAAALAAEFNALSADHLEHTDAAGLDAMARAGVVGVLLPVAFYFLRDTRLPPIAGLRERGIPMAVATDCNPGTAPAASILCAMNMACTLFGLTPEEALAGTTVHAARALGLAEHGSLEAGKRAEFVVWDAQSPAELAWMGPGRVAARMKTAPLGGAV